MAKAIPLIIVALFILTRCDQQQAVQRSRFQMVHALPLLEHAVKNGSCC